MAIVNIRREAGIVVFDPPTIQLGANDFVVWANYDEEAPHQPTLENEPADYWMNDPLPPFVEGQPAASSPAICPTGDAGTSITYVDGLDPYVTGTITF